MIPIVYVSLIWIIYWIEIQFGFNFNKYGVYPRSLKGFRGVFLTHFIHSNPSHLFNNSIPLFVLLASLFYFYKDIAYKTLILGGFFTGVLTWAIAQNAYHIGASGIVYMLFSFVFFSGLIRKHYRLVAQSLIIIFLYGSMVWYVLPIKEGMSWEGHLSGFIVGFILAIVFRRNGITRQEHQFIETEFDSYFDEEGNFNPPKLDDESTEDLH
ncbi:rhomboid family intramembrane serine protease [Polaribacter sp.]|uniref:rhomboid family intramembrane serine protease n=1 Tax=Polaribacter sp. TaxID=1920175 RepID=UPI003F6D367C